MHIVASTLTCLVLVFLFEHSFDAVRQRFMPALSKPVLCKLYWGVIMLLGFVSSRPLITVLIGGIPVAASHIDLSDYSYGPISLQAIVVNIWVLAKSAFYRLTGRSRHQVH